MNNEESSDDRLERIRRHWQLGFAIGSPNSDMRKIQDDFCFVLRLLDQKRSTPPAPATPEVMTTPCPGCGRIGTVHTGTCPTRFTDQPKTPEAHENQYLHAELTTLRQRLAEAEADIKQMSQHADAWKEAFDREWKRAEKAEAATIGLRNAMTAENLRVAADAARWEGAARVLAAECQAARDGVSNYEGDEWAYGIKELERMEAARDAVNANPEAAAVIAAKESKQ